MRRLRRTLLALALVLGVAGATSAVAAPLFTLDEDGGTFLYRARPGESPSAVAEMFGLAPNQVGPFLAANGITDPTRVGAGFLYRIPNAAARALRDRVTALESDTARLTREAAAASAGAGRLTHEVEQARAAAADADARAGHAARLQSLWPYLEALLVLLGLGTGAAITVAVTAVNRQRRAERFARALAAELDEKRKTALAERQESARRILELEGRVRGLEA